MNEQIADLPQFDLDGFSRSPYAWDEAVAQKIAEMDGIGQLNESQLMLLKQLRAYFLRWGTPPALPHVCRVSGLAPDCMNQLFPNPHEAWRIAGLPNPGDEAVAYL